MSETIHGSTIYTEATSYQSAVYAAGVAAVGVALFALGAILDVGVVVFLGMMIVIFGAIGAATLVGTARYSRIELGAEELRVGREVIALSEIDPVLLTQDQLADKVVSDAIMPKLIFSSRPSLFGGALGTGVWQKVVAVRRLDGELLVFGSANPEELKAAMEEVAS